MPPLRVVAGVVMDSAGRVLVSQRLPGTLMAGRWEFPGGKLERGEGRLEGLRRELREELGIRVLSARPLIRFGHDYPALAVSLDIWRIEQHEGVSRGRQGQALQWVEPGRLSGLDLLEADRPVVTAIALPDRYLITGPQAHDDRVFMDRLEGALGRGIRLVQLRLADLGEAPRSRSAADPPERRTACRDLAIACLASCRSAGARLLLNGAPQAMAELAVGIGADGIHVPARELGALATLRGPRPRLIGASCHDALELEQAERAGADFDVLGPVNRTASHPEARPIGWSRFSTLTEGARMPVYAIGGMQPADLPRAWAAGAQGIAAIRSLWGST